MEDRKRICKNSPAVKSNLAALEAHYKDFLNLIMAGSAKYEDFEDEFRITKEKMASLKSLQIKLELEQPSATDLDRRMEQISSAIEQMDASITEYDDIRTRQLISTIRCWTRKRSSSASRAGRRSRRV